MAIVAEALRTKSRKEAKEEEDLGVGKQKMIIIGVGRRKLCSEEERQ